MSQLPFRGSYNPYYQTPGGGETGDPDFPGAPQGNYNQSRVSQRETPSDQDTGTYDQDGWAMAEYGGPGFSAPGFGAPQTFGGQAGGAGMVAAVGPFDPGPAFQSPVGMPQYEQFQAPTMADVEATPGYEFRRKEGQRAIQNAAAAQGIGRTGGAMKDLMRYGQDYATGEYDKAYTRALGENQLGYQRSLQQNQDQYGRALGEYQMGYGQRGDVYGRDLERGLAEARLSETGAGRGLAAQRLGMDSRLQTYDRDYQRALDQYRYPYQQWQDQDTRAWQRTIYPTELGMRAEQEMG